MKKPEITNAMRLCTQHKAPFTPHYYPADAAVSGDEVARLIGEDPSHVFKTLVTVGKSGEHYVFAVPVMKELDLKKAAAAAGEKYIEMVKSRELLPLTGYIHGGCSPIGMKKTFATWFDESAAGCATVIFSAGRIGAQIEIAPDDLRRVIPYAFAPLCD